MRNKHALTRRQFELLRLIDAGHLGQPLDLFQLIQLDPRGATRDAVQCSVHILKRRGMVETRYATRGGKRRLVLSLSAQGASRVSGAASSTSAPDEEEDEDLPDW